MILNSFKMFTKFQMSLAIPELESTLETKSIYETECCHLSLIVKLYISMYTLCCSEHLLRLILSRRQKSQFIVLNLKFSYFQICM